MKNVVTKYAFATRVGFIPQTPGKVNQDAYILAPCLEGEDTIHKHMFGVCDGHGQLGHEVSRYIKERLPVVCRAIVEQDAVVMSQNEREGEVPMHRFYEEMLQRVFLRVD
jgi:serine/threonine protein phosphatase PrpC